MNNYKLNDLYSLKDALQNGTLFKQLYKPYLKKVPQLVPENEEEKMLIALDQYSLALMDLNLYLDLNPTDKEMVNLYKDYLSKYKDLKKEYQALADRDLRQNGYKIYSTVNKDIYNKMQETAKNSE